MGEFNVPRIAILASGDRKSGGGGSTAEKVARDALEGKVALRVGVVVCNNPEGTVGVYSRFDEINKDFDLKGDDHIDVVTINAATHPEGAQERGQTLEESSAICRLFEERGIDFVTTLGYMKVLTGEFVETWGWKPEYGAADPLYHGIYHPDARIFNNHPSILPFTADTHGPGAHARALELFKKGIVTHSAMTYHLVADGVDTGPIIYEELVPIYEDDNADSLGSRVQVVEKELSALIIEGHLRLKAERLHVGA